MVFGAQAVVLLDRRRQDKLECACCGKYKPEGAFTTAKCKRHDKETEPARQKQDQTETGPYEAKSALSCRWSFEKRATKNLGEFCQ